MKQIFAGIVVALLAVVALVSVGMPWGIAFAIVVLIGCAGIVAEYIKPDSRLVGYVKTYSKALLAAGAGAFMFVIVNATFGMSPTHLLGFLQRGDTLGGAINESVMAPYALAELIMAVGCSLVGYFLVYAQSTRLYVISGVLTGIVMLVAVISVQLPAIPAYITAEKAETLDRPIKVVYEDQKGQVIDVNDLYDKTTPHDLAKLNAIAEAFAAGKKVQILGDVRVIQGEKLRAVRIPGPNGKFIGGREFLVDAADLVLKQNEVAKDQPSQSLPSRTLAWCGGVLGTVWGGAVEAAESIRPSKPKTVTKTINFADHEAGGWIDTGLQVKKGDAVRYVGVKHPFTCGGDYQITADTSCHAMADGVVRVKDGQGTITIEVTPQ